MSNTDRSTGADLLRQLRESRGWSWSDLARALRDTARRLGVASVMDQQVTSIRRTVARWESTNDRTSPGDRYQTLLAHIYARTAGGSTAFGPGSDLATFLEALRHFDVPTARVRQLTTMVSRTMSSPDDEVLALLAPAMYARVSAAMREPTRLGDQLLDQITADVASINRQIGTVPFTRLQLKLAPIVETCRRFANVERLTSSETLVTLTVDTFSLAGRLAFETHDDATALALYDEATMVAGRLADRRHRAAVRTSHAMVALHATNDPHSAYSIAKAAVRDAHEGTSYRARARAHAVYAEVCARAGQHREANVALERAWQTADQLSQGEPDNPFNGDRLNGFEGICALHNGNASLAHDRLSRSLARLDKPRDAVQRGIVGTDLAVARLRLGDPQACASLLHRAVDVTATTGGRVSAQRIRQARRELRPWRTEAFVANLDDHIHDTLIGR